MNPCALPGYNADNLPRSLNARMTHRPDRPRDEHEEPEAGGGTQWADGSLDSAPRIRRLRDDREAQTDAQAGSTSTPGASTQLKRHI